MQAMSHTLETNLAAELIGSAMRDSEAPVMEMAGALARINTALVRALSAEDCDCPNLQQDIAICIQSLQFHDRLMQQLMAARRLMGTAAVSGERSSGFIPEQGTVELF